MNTVSISYNQFLEQYKSGDILVLVNEDKAGDFVMSDFGDKNNKRAHLFWTYLGLLMLIPLPIILFFLKHWVYAIVCFFIGYIVVKSARKSASQFVLQNMLESEDFWDYALMHGGAIMQDAQGNKIVSKFTQKFQKG